MKSTSWTALGLVAAVITSAACSVSKSSCDSSAAAVSAAAQRPIASDNARDLEGVLRAYTEDIVWLPPNGEAVNGKPAIKQRYEHLFSNFNINLNSEIVETGVQGNMGFVRGFTSGVNTPVNGGNPVTVNDKFLALVRCEAGVWRISHLMWSPRGQ